MYTKCLFFENILRVCEKHLFLSCEQAFKSTLPTQGRSYYFPSPLGIGLSLPLVGK